MPAPRLTIDQLPEDTALGGAEWLIVQDAGTSKKVAVGVITGISQTALDAHVNDTADAHDASAISAVPSGSLAGTNVQTQLEQAGTGIGTNAAAITDNTNALTTHMGSPTAHSAANITNTAVVGGVASNVQATLDELAARIAALETP
jgi:hypothetical protein